MRTKKTMTALIIIGSLLAVGTAGANEPMHMEPPVVVDGSPVPGVAPAEPTMGTDNGAADEAEATGTAADTTTTGAEPADQREEAVALQIEEPRPILLHQDGSIAVGDRDPFTLPPGRRVFEAEYGKVVDNINLQGIIRVGERQIGLFAVGGSTGGRGGGRDQSQLRRVEVGEALRFFIGDSEYRFDVAQLEERSAVLIGENNEHYKVWL